MNMKINEHIKYWIDSFDDNYKREFYKKCSNTFTKEWIHNIEEFREWIKKKLQK